MSITIKVKNTPKFNAAALTAAIVVTILCFIFGFMILLLHGSGWAVLVLWLCGSYSASGIYEGLLEIWEHLENKKLRPE